MNSVMEAQLASQTLIYWVLILLLVHLFLPCLQVWHDLIIPWPSFMNLVELVGQQKGGGDGVSY